jgi:hypothetical protein
VRRPQLLGLVVVLEDGDVEPVLGQAVDLGHQLPGVLDGFLLEVVAEGEIPQHLEEGVVAAGAADVLEVVVLAAGADAFLRRGGAGVVALLLAKEDVLELVHARVGKQQRGVVGGNAQLRLLPHFAVQIGFDKARGDTVDGDAVFAPFGCQATREAGQGALADGIHRDMGKAQQRHQAADRDDSAPGATLHHPAADALGKVHHTVQVGLH